MRPQRRVAAALSRVPLLVALFLAALVPALALVPAAPAAAHGTKVKLVVAGDGATGVTVRATYEDGHGVEPNVRLVLNATADGGRVVGPIQLTASGEGRGFYSTGPVLSPGRWQVRVSAPKPAQAEVMVVVEARAAQAAPPAAAPAADEPASSTTGRLWWIAGSALALAAVATIATLLVRIRPRRR